MISSFGNAVLSREQMKRVKGGDGDRIVGCYCYGGSTYPPQIEQIPIGPDDDIPSAIAWLCGSSSGGCCNCCY